MTDEITEADVAHQGGCSEPGSHAWQTGPGSLVSSSLAGTNARSSTQSVFVWNKVSLLWTVKAQLLDTWGGGRGFNPSHSSDWMASHSLINSLAICHVIYLLGCKKKKSGNRHSMGLVEEKFVKNDKKESS